MNSIVEDILMHYGMPRRSGRYPYGSGENPYQHSGDFLSRIDELKSQGMSDTEIAKAMGLTIAGVDLMRSDRGPQVLEVNASPGFGIEKVTYRNVAGKILDYIERNAKRGNKKDKIGV